MTNSVNRRSGVKKLPAVILAMMLLFCRDVFSASLLDRVVAVVNNEVITWSELRGIIAVEGKDILKKIPEGRKDEAMQELEREFLAELIDMKLQLQEARRTGIDVSSSEIDGAIADIKKKYNVSDEVLMNSLAAEGLTYEEYRKKLGDQILVSKVVNFNVRSTVVVTDKEIEQYYAANRAKFSGVEKRRIRQIFFAAPKDPSLRSGIEAKADDVLKRISSGEDFAQLAKELSEDPSREFGGDLGYITRGSALKEIEDAAFSMKTGEVSRPFWSAAGLHIIKVEEKVEAEDFEKAKDRIREVLFQKAFESKFMSWKAGLKEKAYIEIKL